MSCGPGAGLSALTDKIGAAKDKANGLIADAEAGIAGAINNLESELDSMAGNVAGMMKGLMPSIELPELDIPDLESMIPELPKLELPEKLQDGLSKLLGAANNPLGLLSMDADLKSLQDKFGLKGADIDKFKLGILSGDINADSLCKLVPNIELSPDGTKAMLGAPATAPEKDAEKPPALQAGAVVVSLDLSELNKANDKLKEELKAYEPVLKQQLEEQFNNLFGTSAPSA